MHILPILTTLLSFSLLSHAYDIKPCGTETTTYMPDSCGTCEPFTWYSTGIWPWSWDYIVKGCFQRQSYGYRCVYTGADYKIPKQWFTGRQNVNHGYDTVTGPLVRQCFYDKYGQKLDSVDIGQGVTKHSSGACSTTARKNDLCVKRAKRIDNERHLEQWYYRPAGGVHETSACKRCPQQKGSETVDVSIANNTLTCDYNLQGSNGRAIQCKYDAVTGIRTYSDSTEVLVAGGYEKRPLCGFEMADRGTLACEERLIKEAKEKAAAAAREEAEKAAANALQARTKFCSLCITQVMDQLVVSGESPPLLLKNIDCRPEMLERQNCPALLGEGALQLKADRCQICKDLSLASRVEGKSESNFAPFYHVLCPYGRLRDGLPGLLGLPFKGPFPKGLLESLSKGLLGPLPKGLLLRKELLPEIPPGELPSFESVSENILDELPPGAPVSESIPGEPLSNKPLLEGLLGPVSKDSLSGDILGPLSKDPLSEGPLEGVLGPLFKEPLLNDLLPNKLRCEYSASMYKTVMAEGCSKCTIADPPSSFRVPVTNESIWYQDGKDQRYWLFTCPKDAKNVMGCSVDQKPENGSKKGSLPDVSTKEKPDEKGKGDEKGKDDEKGDRDGKEKVYGEDGYGEKGYGEKGDGDAKETADGAGEKKADGAGGYPDGSDKEKGVGDGVPLEAPPEK